MLATPQTFAITHLFKPGNSGGDEKSVLSWFTIIHLEMPRANFHFFSLTA